MNPFMERTWADVHVALIADIRSVLGIELPEDLSAKGETQVNVSGGEAPGYRPEEAANAGPQVDEPLLVEVEEAPHRWVEIRSDEGQLVTVIEVLSPANKRHHREAYVSKRGDYVAAGVNVVEIDLLRGGPVTVDVAGFDYRRQKPGLGEHYLICASRGVKPGRREIYPCPLRQRLPVIRIPLRPTDPDVPLDVQSLINHCYTSGRYWKLDYTVPLDPPLSAEDAVWVREVLEGMK